MNQIPKVEVRIRDFGADLYGLMEVRQEEVKQYLEAGIERALEGIGAKIIEEAARLATEKIEEEVKQYLLYGEGAQALRAAIAYGLRPLTEMLLAASGREATDAHGVADPPAPSRCARCGDNGRIHLLTYGCGRFVRTEETAGG